MKNSLNVTLYKKVKYSRSGNHTKFAMRKVVSMFLFETPVQVRNVTPWQTLADKVKQ